MEQIKTRIDESASKDLFSKTIILMVVAFVFGLIMIGMYILFSISNNNWADILNIICLILGSVLVVVSIIFTFLTIKAIKGASGNTADTVADFYDDHIYLETFRNNELIGNAKIFYNDILGYTVGKKFIFLKIKNNQMLPFTKSEELEKFVAEKGIKKI